VAISHEDGAYQVKDLGSTNGSSLNGRRIAEAVLSDGDLLGLADVELTFFLPPVERNRAVTQVIDSGQDGTQGVESASRVIREYRRLQHTLSLGQMATLFQPIVELAGRQTFGYEALDASLDHRPAADRLVLECESRWTGHLRHLHRLAAAEQSRGLPNGATLVLPLDASEMGTSGLADSLGALNDRVAESCGLVVQIAQAAVCDLPHFREFCGQMRQQGIALSYDGFSAAHLKVLESQAIRPDYLRLVASLVRNVHRNHQRQGQMRSVAAVADDFGCQVIAAGIEGSDEADACRECGCRLGQGPLFGQPMPSDPPDRERTI
jgi:EAL domain-containing protein (putative c-di-GMP-specific phosphodiesterase class I)